MDPDNIQTFTIEAYEELFMTHYQALTRTAYRILNDAVAAEDIVQDVFCKVWEKKDELRITTSLKSYLFRMVINGALNYIEKNKALYIRETGYSSFLRIADDTTTDDMNAKELKRKVETVINGLPPTCRKIFILSRYEQFSYKEIAEELNISVKAVENQITKALKSLRNMLSLLVFLKLFLH